MMLVIGLTGGIGMGKSTVAQRFRERGIAVCDADAEVHKLYAGKAVPLIEAAFPGTTADGMVDRARLAAALLGDEEALKRLEAIVHPLVLAAEREFLRSEARRGAVMAVLEVPLLFETGGDRRCDVTIVVSAGPDEQRARVLARPGMTEARLAQILARQMPDVEKRQRADFVVDTSLKLEETLASVDAIIDSLAGRTGTAYDRFWA
jgi:dephospho-CoA kinase